MRSRALSVLVVLLLAAACSSSSKKSSSSSTNTTAGSQAFQVQTPDGQVSLSLNGQLPPNWPSSFPVPSGAKAAGSGSLVNGNQGASVGVYSTSEAAADVFTFYKTNPSLTVTSASSAGVAGAYVGTVKLGGTYPGSNVTIAALSGTTYIVIILKPASSSSTTTPTTTAGATSTTSTTG